MKISLASFCRLRPIFIVSVNFTCLCRRHQNMALKLKVMKSAGVLYSTNPDTFAELDTTQTTDLLTEIKVDPARYMVWKKVQIEVNKEKMKIVNVSAAKEEFIKVVKEEIMEFKDHVERVKNQYNQGKFCRTAM